MLERKLTDTRARSTLMLLLVVFFVSCSSVSIKPLVGTFLDIQYDGRLKYTNEAAKHFSCQQWEDKITEMANMGLEYIIFQAVANYGYSFYPSKFHPYSKIACPNALNSVLISADKNNLKVFLSCEYVYSETDSITDPKVMATRIGMMNELFDGGYTTHTSFVGWYFSQEAFISPYFTDNFLKYLTTLSTHARTLTSNATIFISPYGTHTAVCDDKFTKQLQSLPADIVAYQDEVGCVRVRYPVASSSIAFRNLRCAHNKAPRVKLWANIESFTWEDQPNNVTSALIPASFPRIIAQMDAVTSAGVDNIVTFTVQGIYEPLHSGAPWGIPSSKRLFLDYQNYFVNKEKHSLLLGDCVHGAVSHQGIGAKYSLPTPPSPTYSKGNLTNGLTSKQYFRDPQWLGFLTDVILVVDMGQAVFLETVGIHFLQDPVPSIYLPSEVLFFGSVDGRTYSLISTVTTHWWEQEIYDIRTELYVVAPYLEARYIRIQATNARPPWAVIPSKENWLFIDEVIINP